MPSDEQLQDIIKLGEAEPDVVAPITRGSAAEIARELLTLRGVVKVALIVHKFKCAWSRPHRADPA